MNVMFESSAFFVRIRSKGAHLKITIWNNTGDKLFSDFWGPDPAAQFWQKVENLTDITVVADLQKRIFT